MHTSKEFWQRRRRATPLQYLNHGSDGRFFRLRARGVALLPTLIVVVALLVVVVALVVAKVRSTRRNGPDDRRRDSSDLD